MPIIIELPPINIHFKVEYIATTINTIRLELILIIINTLKVLKK